MHNIYTYTHTLCSLMYARSACVICNTNIYDIIIICSFYPATDVTCIADSIPLLLTPNTELYHCIHAGPPDRNTPSEDEMLQVYRTEARRLNVTFCKKAFNYAKAVNCLRLITIVRVSKSCTFPCRPMTRFEHYVWLDVDTLTMKH